MNRRIYLIAFCAFLLMTIVAGLFSYDAGYSQSFAAPGDANDSNMLKSDSDPKRYNHGYAFVSEMDCAILGQGSMSRIGAEIDCHSTRSKIPAAPKKEKRLAGVRTATTPSLAKRPAERRPLRLKSIEDKNTTGAPLSDLVVAEIASSPSQENGTGSSGAPFVSGGPQRSISFGAPTEEDETPAEEMAGDPQACENQISQPPEDTNETPIGGGEEDQPARQPGTPQAAGNTGDEPSNPVKPTEALNDTPPSSDDAPETSVLEDPPSLLPEKPTDFIAKGPDGLVDPIPGALDDTDLVTPIPGAAPLMISGIAAYWAFLRRRKSGLGPSSASL